MTPTNPRPARLTSAGTILRRELAARGWSQRDLAEIIGRPAQAISEIVQGSKRITAETSLELAAALGTSAEVWLRLDASHWLRVAEKRPETAAARRAIQRRSRARSGGPPLRSPRAASSSTPRGGRRGGSRP